MKSHSYTSLSDVTSLLSKSCLCTELKDPSKEQFTETLEDADMDESMDFDDLEEVFADHILMDKRLRKTLYAGNFCGLEDLPDHPPIALTGLALELFSKAAPNYGLDILDMDYVSAASEAARISPCAMIIAMIYLERLQLKNSEYLETVSPPGLFVVTMLVASKFLFEDEEDIATNQMWAEALNFDIKELNTLEREFLSAMDWKVFVDSSEYLSYLYNVEKVIAVKQSSLRNWLSYSDMYVLCQDPAFQHFWKTFLKKIVKATLFWTLGYAATALVLYSTTLAFQKLKMEKHNALSLAVQNDTLEIQNSAFVSLDSLYVKDKFVPNTQHIADFSPSTLNFEMSNEQHTSYTLQNWNCYSTMATLKRKVSVYRVEITKVLSPKKFQVNSNYFMLKDPSLNDSYANRDWSTLRKSMCVSVKMR